MKIRIINKRLGMSGTDIKFENENFFDLQVGDTVSQIGNGKENGTIRTDLFDVPVKYVGSVVCQFDTPEKMYAFLIPERIEGEDAYLLYGSTGTEIFTEGVFSMKSRHNGQTTGYMRFYKPTFLKAVEP